MNKITIEKNNLVGKRLLIIKHNGMNLELPLSVSKICVACPCWEDETLIFSESCFRPKCNRYKCTGYLEKDEVDNFSPDCIFAPFGDCFNNIWKLGDKNNNERLNR